MGLRCPSDWLNATITQYFFIGAMLLTCNRSKVGHIHLNLSKKRFDLMHFMSYLQQIKSKLMLSNHNFVELQYFKLL